MQHRVLDGHNDVLHEMRQNSRPPEWFFAGRDGGHIDLPRARRGGLSGGLFAIFVPSPEELRFGPNAPLPKPVDRDYAGRETLAIAALALRLEREADGRLEIVRDAPALDRCLDSDGDRLACVLHLEGADGIDDDLDLLAVLHASGLRSLGLVWSRPNAFAEGVPLRHPSSPDTGPGLTRRGRELVRACNDLGILVDLAHLNERGFWHVAHLSRAPLVASHTAVHALSPAARNLTDEQIDAIGATGGLAGITFHVGDLRADGRQDADTSLDQLARHLEHVAERIGIDHVALGSDFDGALIPKAIGDAAGLPRLLDHLRDRGWDDEALRKLSHANWARTLATAWSAP